MATWGPVIGGARFLMAGGGCTNHEAFAFELESADVNVGATITAVDIYINTTVFGETPTYGVDVQAVDINGNPTNDLISGSFNSNGV